MSYCLVLATTIDPQRKKDDEKEKKQNTEERTGEPVHLEVVTYL